MNEHSAHEHSGDHLRGMRMLVVEDDRALRHALTERLALLGCSVVGAGSVSEARSHLDASMPDMLLLDLGLPDGSGLAVLQYLEDSGKAVPRTIVLTNDDTPVTVSHAVEHRAFDYVVKADLSMDAIVDLIIKRSPRTGGPHNHSQ